MDGGSLSSPTVRARQVRRLRPGPKEIVVMGLTRKVADMMLGGG